MPTANIVTSDRGWILEKLASEIADRLPYVTYDEAPNPYVDLQYYITYSSRRSRVSPIEVGYFAHLEKDPATAKLFFDTAAEVDFCVCHAEIYAQKLKDAGIETVRTIPPGVDLDVFRPKLQIGVVGRTYHTGRKGEALIAELMDLDWVEFHFTGEGWPGPAQRPLPAEMPDFYRRMDYILVPALYEGGPMCVPEALACGTPVIAPPVGWVSEFPHIEYRTGDADHLRQILRGLYEQKLELRSSTLDFTWDTWAQAHDQLFQGLFETHSERLAERPRKKVGTRVFPVDLLIHGSEGTDQGGPSIRAPQTASRLKSLGYDARLRTTLNYDPKSRELLHVYNIWHPESASRAMKFGRMAGQTIVFSPIFLDLSEREIFEKGVQGIFRKTQDPIQIDAQLAELMDHEDAPGSRGAALIEPMHGYFGMVRQMMQDSDAVIYLSETERANLSAIGANTDDGHIVHNPVQPELWASATGDMFKDAFGIDDYVLCVGRLEARKNQLLLLHAMRDLDTPIVLIGHASNPAYRSMLVEQAGSNVHFIDRLPNGGDMLASAVAGARVFCLPSWAEGAPLAALEAAAAGSNMVLSNRSGEREYFGDHARYCDPSQPASIREAVLEAMDSPKSAGDVAALKELVAEQYSWERHVEKTAQVYEEALTAHMHTPLPKAITGKIYVDLTSSANRKGPPSGIARVEETYARWLLEIFPDQIEYILWNGEYQKFIPVTPEALEDRTFKNLVGRDIPAYEDSPDHNRPYDLVDFAEDSILLVLGGAWIRNHRYIRDLAATANVKRLRLISFIHDVIQQKFDHWFPDGVGEVFSDNCRRLIKASDLIIGNSQRTLKDVRAFCEIYQEACPPLHQVRFGDEIEDSENGEEPDIERIHKITGERPFVLYVSALDIRKNHRLLHDIWSRMIEEHGVERTPHLLLVGSKGWGTQSVIRAIEADRIASQRISIVHGIDDLTLDYLYREAIFTVYPSLYEGWGLPVAEAIARGKVCVASNAGSVPEIAPEVTDLIDPLDFTSWYDRITSYVLNSGLLAERAKVVAAYQTTTWYNSTNDLAKILREAQISHRRWPHIALDQKMLTRANSKFEQFLAGGWHAPEKKGVWSSGAVGTLIFRPLIEAPLPLVVELSVVGYTPGSLPSPLEIVVGDHTVAQVELTGGSTTIVAPIPAECFEVGVAGQELRLDFITKRPLRPCEQEDSSDARLLGVRLETIKFRAPEEHETSLFQELSLRPIQPTGRLLSTVGKRKAPILSPPPQYKLEGITEGSLKLNGAWIGGSDQEGPTVLSGELPKQQRSPRFFGLRKKHKLVVAISCKAFNMNGREITATINGVEASCKPDTQHKVGIVFPSQSYGDEIEIGFQDLPQGARLKLEGLSVRDAPHDKFENAMMAADFLRDLGCWGAAAEKYQAAVDINPAADGAWMQLGHMLKEAGRPFEAENAYLKALVLSPNCSEVHYQIGHLFNKLGEYRLASNWYQRAAVLAPTDREIRHHIDVMERTLA